MGDEENDYDQLAKDVRDVGLLFVESMSGSDGIHNTVLATQFDEALSALSVLERRCVGLAEAVRLYSKPEEKTPEVHVPPVDEYEIRTVKVLYRKDDHSAVEAFMDAMSEARDDENACIEWHMCDGPITLSRESARLVIGWQFVNGSPPVADAYSMYSIYVLHRSNDADGVRRFMDFIGRAESDGLFVGCYLSKEVAVVSRREAESRLYTTIEEEA